MVIYLVIYIVSSAFDTATIDWSFSLVMKIPDLYKYATDNNTTQTGNERTHFTPENFDLHVFLVCVH